MDDLPTDSAAVRAALRREKIAARLAMPPAERSRAEAAIRTHLETLLSPYPPGIVAFCLPVRGEVNCRPSVERLLAAGWQAAMPTVARRQAPMEFRAWAPDTPMMRDPHGIDVPAPPVIVLPDVLLLPLVAFDVAGYRLGYGGGYFDRTLAAHTAPLRTIGIGFDLCAIPDISPMPHDVPLDVVITESGVRYVTAATALPFP